MVACEKPTSFKRFTLMTASTCLHTHPRSGPDVPSDTCLGGCVPSDTCLGGCVPSDTCLGGCVPSDTCLGGCVPSDTCLGGCGPRTGGRLPDSCRRCWARPPLRRPSFQSADRAFARTRHRDSDPSAPHHLPPGGPTRISAPAPIVILLAAAGARPGAVRRAASVEYGAGTSHPPGGGGGSRSRPSWMLCSSWDQFETCVEVQKCSLQCFFSIWTRARWSRGIEGVVGMSGRFRGRV
eukprot:gene25153-biopygen4482